MWPISDVDHDVDENYTLLHCYAVSSGNSLLTFGGRLPRNVEKELSLFAM
jgi:hypothetical protein